MHDIYDKISGLDITPTSTPPVIIFLAGFPDTVKSWSRLKPHFESTHHVVTLALPDYESNKLNKFWGYSFTEIINNIKQLIHYYREEKGCKTIHLVGHDWGSYMVSLFSSRYPHLVTKLVLLDIGVMVPTEMDVKTFLVNASYVLYLAFMFLLSRIIFDKFVLVLIGLYPWYFIGPCPYERSLPCAKNLYEIKAYMTYPYFHMVFNPEDKSIKLGKLGTIPTLYCYGTKKRVLYHTKRFLDILNKNPNSQIVELKDMTHWFHWTEPEKTAEILMDFLIGKKKKT